MATIDELFQAVYAADIQAIRQITTDDPALARARNADTLSVLHFARFLGRTDVLDALIAAGPPLDIFDAAALDLTVRVRECLDAEPALVTARSAEGFTGLHLASYYGAPDVVRLLLDRGAGTEAVTDNFLANMPIHAAAAGRRTDICRMLLERGADVNARQHGGFVPLHTAAQHGDRAMTDLFLAHGADPRVTNDEGKSPADIAAAQGNIEIAALLRCAGASV
jgi:ankyrin repeat protein